MDGATPTRRGFLIATGTVGLCAIGQAVSRNTSAAAAARRGPEAPPPAVSGARFTVLSVLQHDAVAGAHDIEVRTGLAFVAGKANKYLPGKAGRFAVLDVSAPARPRVLSMLDERTNPGLYNAETVLLRGETCLLGTNDLLAIDIRDPARPRVTARVRHAAVSHINGMIGWGHHVLAASKRGFVAVFDAAKPRHPRFAGALNTVERGNLRWPHDIARFGDRYVVVPSAGRSAPVQVGIYAVSDDGTTLRPVDRWRFVGGVSRRDLAGANRVAVGARHAYVACHYSHRVGVIDLSALPRLRQVASLRTAGCEPDGLALAGDTLFVGAGRTVEAIDVSDPRSPRSVACLRGEPLFTKPRGGGKANAHDLVIRDGLVYATAQRDGRVGIVRFEPGRGPPPATTAEAPSEGGILRRPAVGRAGGPPGRSTTGPL